MLQFSDPGQVVKGTVSGPTLFFDTIGGLGQFGQTHVEQGPFDRMAGLA